MQELWSVPLASGHIRHDQFGLETWNGLTPGQKCSVCWPGQQRTQGALDAFAEGGMSPLALVLPEREVAQGRGGEKAGQAGSRHSGDRNVKCPDPWADSALTWRPWWGQWGC